ncbi:acyl-CoA dehydrogenase family protein [uncultured Deefgea sp.]|uniref:acyl-CoA dehydrogenase family protein n=1 Tax=uncultured Deefgea sp. TaxID=1304914 RepID=UPI00262BC813|nr:acyl-CoA dehydrogenase family protein [uncultured Deefgea sp.]
MVNWATLDSIISDTIAPAAIETDKNAVFPRAAMTRLGEAGWLGLLSSAEVGGLGLSLNEAAKVIEKIAEACPTTAMVLCMHYCGSVAIEAFGRIEIRREIAAGRHLTTLAWSENGSRSHFWAPVSTAHLVADKIALDAEKSWVTSACEADSYVWTSKPLAAEGLSTLWYVPSNTAGLTMPKPFDGMGLRGNASSPIYAKAVMVNPSDQMGQDGAGFDIMMGTVLPVFAVLTASCSVGIIEALMQRTVGHVTGMRYQHTDSALADLPTIRAYIGKAKIRADMARALRDDTLAAMACGRADTLLRVLEVRVGCAETALEVGDMAMRVCGGAAFRKDVGVERYFRDSRTAAIMGPTSDVLFEFIGRATCGMDLFS